MRVIHWALKRFGGRRVGGGDDRTGELFSYVDLEARVRRDHPLRVIRATVAGLRKTRFRGRDNPGRAITFAAAAYNLVRLPKLMALPA